MPTTRHTTIRSTTDVALQASPDAIAERITAAVTEVLDEALTIDRRPDWATLEVRVEDVVWVIGQADPTHAIVTATIDVEES